MGVFAREHYRVEMTTAEQPARGARLFNYQPLAHGYVYYVTEPLELNALPCSLAIGIVPKRALTMTYTSQDGARHAIRLDDAANSASPASPYYFIRYTEPAHINYATLKFTE